MAATRPLEEVILSPVEHLIKAHLKDLEPSVRDEKRLQILEAAASRLGGFDLDWYLDASRVESRPGAEEIELSKRVAEALGTVPIHPALALSSLAKPELSRSSRRVTGAYYTDFRLAEYLVRPLKNGLIKQPLILDPASGTGILLTAAVVALEAQKTKRRSALIAESIYAADLSARALRGAALALSSLTDDHGAITSLRAHLRQGDSLVQGNSLWADVAPEGFDAVVGNPPWEKLKLSRHEFLESNGVDRHYGDGYEESFSFEDFSEVRYELGQYAARLAKNFDLQGAGEHDLYKLFLELAVRFTRAGGHILLLIPAGLIRSLGTQHLREFLLSTCGDIEITLLENRSRFFAIDTRFKFLALQASHANGHGYSPLKLTHATASQNEIQPHQTVSIDRAILPKTRADLSIPEVRNADEWRVFRDVALKGIKFGDAQGPWKPLIMREVDMTRDRNNFHPRGGAGLVPVMEGRMLHQYRHAAKRYVSGTGRRAVWAPVPPNAACEISPQFWYREDELPPAARPRASVTRVGFCDITGQTNERTMLASRIPPGVVCGNKVPTILFDVPRQQKHISDCWLAIANSLPFDWLLRRVVTTTVNFFLLRDMPLPRIEPLGSVGLKLADLGDVLGACVHDDNPAGGRVDLWGQAEARSEIDCIVLHSYGHGLGTLELMLEDFPLLDRAQPPIRGEKRSTVTRDYLLLRAAEMLGEGSSRQVREWRARTDEARAAGAVPYVPSHLG